METPTCKYTDAELAFLCDVPEWVIRRTREITGHPAPAYLTKPADLDMGYGQGVDESCEQMATALIQWIKRAYRSSPDTQWAVFNRVVKTMRLEMSKP